jgi:peroxiredoxin
VVAVSLDDASARDRALECAATNSLPFTVWLDPDEHAITAFSASSLPVTLVIDRRGVIVFRRDGVITASDAELTSALESALAR